MVVWSYRAATVAATATAAATEAAHIGNDVLHKMRIESRPIEKNCFFLPPCRFSARMARLDSLSSSSSIHFSCVLLPMLLYMAKGETIPKYTSFNISPSLSLLAFHISLSVPHCLFSIFSTPKLTFVYRFYGISHQIM